MATEWDDGASSKRVAAVLVVIVVLAIGAVMFMGAQTSKILSTVGASVGPPGGGIVGSGVDEGESGGVDAGADDHAGDAGSGGGGTADVDPATVALDVDRPDLLIIKTGEISIQAESIGPAIDAATNAIVAMGGYASGSERFGEGREAEASVTFRIPSDRWEAALAAVRGAGEAVLAEHTETADVTGEVVDLHARIGNLRATETAFAAIMAKAVSIRDVLEVQEQLTSVRGQIEQLEAKVGDLEDRASLSTLTLRVQLRPTPAVARQESRFNPGRETEAATAQLVAILQALATAGIWFGIVWLPMLIAFGLVGGVGFVVARRVMRRLDDRAETLVDAAGGPA